MERNATWTITDSGTNKTCWKLKDNNLKLFKYVKIDHRNGKVKLNQTQLINSNRKVNGKKERQISPHEKWKPEDPK